MGAVRGTRKQRTGRCQCQNQALGVAFEAQERDCRDILSRTVSLDPGRAPDVFQQIGPNYAEVLLREYTLSAISWIGSVQLVIMYITGIILGRAFYIYGARVCSILRSLLVLSLLTQPPISAIACHCVDPFHVLAHDDLLVPRILSTHARTRDRTRPWNCVTVRSLRCARTLATHLPLPWQVLSHCVNFALTPYTLR